MNPALRNQLNHLDRTLLALLNERARLVAEDGDRAPSARIDDLLSRNPGPLAAAAVREVFDAIDRGCAAPARS